MALMRVLLAVDRDDLDVLAGLAAGLECRDRTDRHLVVVGVDGGTSGCDCSSVSATDWPLARVKSPFATPRSACRSTGLDRLVEALLAVDRRRRAGRALELDDLRLAAGGLGHATGRPPALIDEVGADEGDVVLAGLGDVVVDVAVERKTGMPAAPASLTDVGDLLGDRGDEQDVRLLGDQALDVGDLLGLVVVGVGDGQLEPLLGRLLLHARGLGQAARGCCSRSG